MNITWLGQGGFLFATGETRLAVDPYLSDFVERKQNLTRLMDPPLSVEQLAPTAVFCTHDHIDHLDPIGATWLARAWPEAPFIGPASVIAKLPELGLADVPTQQLDPGQTTTIGELTITATPAIHSDPCAVGLILTAGGKRVYLSGDSQFAPDLADRVAALAGGPIDLVLICINGRLGNMNADEAVDIVKALRPGRAAPMHYGLFAENTADPQPFLDAVRQMDIAAEAMTPGTPFAIE
jgi:L-ascorbate metabolism protein UlaG (beta-lactamase superfamily)